MLLNNTKTWNCLIEKTARNAFQVGVGLHHWKIHETLSLPSFALKNLENYAIKTLKDLLLSASFSTLHPTILVVTSAPPPYLPSLYANSRRIHIGDAHANVNCLRWQQTTKSKY